MSLDTQQQAMDYLSRRSVLQKRQSDVPPTNVSDIPAPVPTNTTTSTTSTADLSHSLTDHQFDLGFVGNNLPLTFACKNCSTFGSMTLTRGEFKLANATEIAEEAVDDDKPVQLLDSGSIEMQVNDFFAHIELESELAAVFSHGFNLFTLPIVGYQVPHFGVLGVFLNVTLITSLKVQGGLTFGYGFEVTLPQSSNVSVDFTNLNKSSQHGFDDATFNTLPLTANLSSVDLTVSASMHPEIMFGFEFDEKALGKVVADLEAGVFLNVPTLAATFSLAPNGSDATCAPEKGLSDQDKSLVAELGDLTHIVPSAEVDLGVKAGVGVSVNNIGPAFEVGTVLLSTTWALPTACIAYDQAASTFGDAQQMFAAKTSSASASAARASRGAAAGMVRPPLKGLFTARDGAMIMGSVFALMIAGGVFTVL